MFKQTTIDAIEKRFIEPPEFTNFKAAYAEADDDEKICLKYYYAFMPVSDLVSYDASLFLKIIRHTIKVRKMNIFGDNVPDDILLNFVLHYRVNNENIEYNREIMFNELYGRVKGKSLYDAVLEVNYWCLEKATYIGTNPRTVSPLTIIKNTTGRCGEESTFTVSALRSLGIPARQIYTPRWSHCDSNHAWVEAYIDGKWQFLGACEPEPVLNKGWFTGPASRGVLMHTRVFSTIVENEEIAYKSNQMAELNLTKLYAKVDHFTISVKNIENKKVKVFVEVPNYCSMNPIIGLVPDENGVVSLTLGRGDFLIRVSDGEKFVFRKVEGSHDSAHTPNERHIEIDFANAVSCEHENITMKLVPSALDDSPAQDCSKLMEAHDKRIKECNEIRANFFKTFIDEEKGAKIAENYPGFKADIIPLLIASKGNFAEVIAFLDYKTDIPFKYKIMMLKAIDKKDLTDCEAHILAEHLEYAYKFRDNYFEDIYMKYLLSPRVYLEMLVPYRKFILEFFDDAQKAEFVKNPVAVYNYIKENITDATDDDYKTLIGAPEGLLKFKTGSEISRKALFVSICRSVGIAARFNPHDGDLEYYKNGAFVRVVQRVPVQTSKLTIKCAEKLEFSKNISIARLIDGGYQNLFFRGENENIFDLEQGHYRILTGERLADGSMLMNMYFIEMTLGNDASIEVEIPKEEANINVVAVESFEFSSNGKQLTLGSLIKNDNTILAFIEPSKEPSEHLLKELMDAKELINEKGVGIVLVSNDTNKSLELVKETFAGLTVIPVNKTDYSFAEKLCSGLGIESGKYPVMALIDTELNTKYNSIGYNVGSVDMALKIVQ